MKLRVLIGLAAGLASTACATQEQVRAMKRPELPPTRAIAADRGDKLFRSIAIYEIEGAPEWPLFDGGDIVTTRPLRAQVKLDLERWLDQTQLLANNIQHSSHLLTVEFTNLRGPNLIPFSDKAAIVKATFTLRERRTGKVVLTTDVAEAKVARMPGLTESMVRSAVHGAVFGGAVAQAVTSSDGEMSIAYPLIGALTGAKGARHTARQQFLLSDPAVQESSTLDSIAQGITSGFIIGGLTSLIDERQKDSTIWEQRALGVVAGALSGAAGAANSRPVMDNTQEGTFIGAFNGALRREQASVAALRGAYAAFTLHLVDAGYLRVRDAVPCSVLNPDGYGTAILITTPTAIGTDCPRS